MSANPSATPAFPISNSPIVIADRFSPDAQVSLHLGDCLELLQAIKDSCVKADLILTSPPYNVGKSYETKQPLEIYLANQRRTIEACLEVLSESGSLCWQVGTYIKGRGKQKVVIPLVVDPYLGSGTTAVAAVMHGRRAAGADIKAEYLAVARERLLQAHREKKNDR